MADKHHRAISGHVRNLRQHIKNANDSADKIEQLLSAMKDQQMSDQQQPQQMGPTSAGVSPLGGQAT
jgi:hypothetical protein